MARKTGKLKQAVDALASISVLDTRLDATVKEAVIIAEQALRAIGEDRLSVSLQKRDGKAHIFITSAAGNEAAVRELAPLVKQLIDAAAGQSIEWAVDKFHSASSDQEGA